MTAAERNLDGIRVLEIGELVSAPYATRLLADLGAEVIKVEPPGGEPARRRGPFRNDQAGHPDASGLFLALNTGKRSVVLDADDEGRRHLAALVASADLVVTNLDPGRLAALGFDPDRALAQRPELVICSITPFGLTGPHAGYRAEDLTVSHAGGWAYQCPGDSDDPGEPPLKVYGHQTQFHAGIAAATVALAAYDRAAQTGCGDHIDFSAGAHITGLLEAALIAASYMDLDPNRLGSRLLQPWKIFPCGGDGGHGDAGDPEELVFLVTVEQDQWERLVAFMGHPEWATSGLFDTVELRLENEDLLAIYLEEWTRQHSLADLWHGGQAHRICFAPVLTMAQMAEQDHLRQRGFLVDVDHPVAGTVTHLGPPLLSSPSLAQPPRPAPLLDADARPTFGPGRPRPRPAGGGGERRRPLEGVRVLDFSWVWAGPYATMHLAFLGADVIKIESASRPGLGRRLPLHPPDVEPSLNTSAYFNQWDQGKRSCQLDLGDPEAVELVKELVAHCDVVVENFATGVMDKLGLGWDVLSAINPGLIMASVSGYGSEGPLRHYMGYGPTTGPLSGLSSLTGFPGGPPRELGISIGDPAAGIAAAFGVCAALVARRASGQGCYLDVALWEATASNAVEGWMAHALTGCQPERLGNRDPHMAPHGCYRIGDRLAPGDDGPDPGLWLTIACADDDQWRALATLIDGDTAGRAATDSATDPDPDPDPGGGWPATSGSPPPPPARPTRTSSTSGSRPGLPAATGGS